LEWIERIRHTNDVAGDAMSKELWMDTRGLVLKDAPNDIRGNPWWRSGALWWKRLEMGNR
jgi:hypothetical protein